jgi:hypothetical protein
MPMMAITTSNSTSVNPILPCRFIPGLLLKVCDISVLVGARGGTGPKNYSLAVPVSNLVRFTH